MVSEKEVQDTMCQEAQGTFLPCPSRGNSTQIPVGLHWKPKLLLGSLLNNLTEFKRIPTLPRMPQNISQTLKEKW